MGGGDATLQRLHDLKPAAFPELAKAFAAADGGLAQLAVFPPKDAAKVLDSITPTLPAEVGGGSSKMLSHGFRWAAVGFDGPKLKLKLTIQAADADSARACSICSKRPTPRSARARRSRSCAEFRQVNRVVDAENRR